VTSPVIVLPKGTFHVNPVIKDCEWKLRTFLERDAYAPYDYEHTVRWPGDDRLEARHRIAMNAAMRARSSTAAWDAFLDQPIPELSKVPKTLCLVRGDEQKVRRGIEAIGGVVARFGAVRGLTDMAATKMLYLLRPRFVAISDSYVRTCLGMPETNAPGPGPWRASFVQGRVMDVMRGMRALAQANDEALRQLEAFAAGLSPVRIADDTQLTTKRYRGREIPVVVSPVRILDILLWADGAIFGRTPDPMWAAWWEQRRGPRRG
jgi:hypothetical protein